VGVPDQYFVEEPETLDGGGKTLISPCCVQRCGIDTLHVIPERIVKRPYRIYRFCHDNSLCGLVIKDYLFE
jgi:hypothetical protein